MWTPPPCASANEGAALFFWKAALNHCTQGGYQRLAEGVRKAKKGAQSGEGGPAGCQSFGSQLAAWQQTPTPSWTANTSANTHPKKKLEKTRKGILKPFLFQREALPLNISADGRAQSAGCLGPPAGCRFPVAHISHVARRVGQFFGPQVILPLLGGRWAWGSGLRRWGGFLQNSSHWDETCNGLHSIG